MSDYFDLSFTALPHKVLAADKFESEVQRLRGRFINSDSDDFLFKPAYHKRIPADGVAFYMENIWVWVHIKRLHSLIMLIGTSSNEQGSRSSYTTRTVGSVQM